MKAVLEIITEPILDRVFSLSKGKIAFSGLCETKREENGKILEQAYWEVFRHEGAT